MNRFYSLVIFLGLLGALVAASTPRAYAQQAYYPSGLHGRSGVIAGIYPGTAADNCCWMGARATLKVTVPAGADTLLVNVYLPKFGAPAHGQSLRVRIGKAPAQERCCFGAGEHELTFALPASARHGIAFVQLRTRSTFVPREIGLNQDPRHLSVLIRGIAFENGTTGERFDSAPLPWLPARAALPLLALGGILVLVLTLRRPVFGVAALVLTDPFLLAYTIHGTSVTLPKITLLAVAVGMTPRLAQILRNRPGTALRLLAAAQLLFALTMIPASLHAAFHAAAARETLKALEYAATLLVAYAAYRLDPDEDAVRLCLSIITIAVAVLAFAQEFSGALQYEVIAGHTVARIAGPLEGPNQLAGFLGVLVPAMVAFAVWHAPLTIERLAISLGTLACFLTFSRAGMGALLLAVAALAAVRYAPARRSVLGAGLLVLFVAALTLAFGVFAGAVHGRAQALFGSSGDHTFNGGLGSRLALWHGAYAIWRSHPLFGIGPGNYEFAIGRYDPGIRTHANSMYFQVLAEQGIAGLVAMFAVVAASIGVFIRRLNQPLALGACAAALAMAFHQIVDCMWIYPKVGIIWWVLLALGAAAVDLRAASERVAKEAVA